MIISVKIKKPKILIIKTQLSHKGMAKTSLFMNSTPRDLIEFVFLIVVGFTSGSCRLI